MGTREERCIPMFRKAHYRRRRHWRLGFTWSRTRYEVRMTNHGNAPMRSMTSGTSEDPEGVMKEFRREQSGRV